jgi:hypothetical protein
MLWVIGHEHRAIALGGSRNQRGPSKCTGVTGVGVERTVARDDPSAGSAHTGKNFMRLRERKSRRERNLELQGQTLVGIVDAAMVMACADGELTADEVNVVGQVIDGFFDGQASRNDVEAMISASLGAIEAEGIDARMNAIAENLQTEELRALALAAAAAVALADEEGDEDEEDETYLDLADALDISEDDAKQIMDDVAAQYA